MAVLSMTPSGAPRLVEQIQCMGRNSLGLSADATKSEDMDRVAEQALGEFGSIDTLVNCVGDSIRKPLVTLPDSGLHGMNDGDWRFILDVNLTEAFQGCRALCPSLSRLSREGEDPG